MTPQRRALNELTTYAARASVGSDGSELTELLKRIAHAAHQSSIEFSDGSSPIAAERLADLVDGLVYIAEIYGINTNWSHDGGS